VALRLRSARPADASAIAELHLASWRDAYRGVLDDDFLDGPLAELVPLRWAEALAAPRREGLVVVAALGGEVAGFVAILRRGTVAYVDNLHVRPGLRGAGIGRLLLGFGATRMRERGCTAAELTVFAQNEGALRFYERLGAVTGPEDMGETFGQKVMERRCAWPDIAKLVQATAAAPETS
jgi:ribosomal protein S18 acetylase RimI-like enzyme